MAAALLAFGVACTPAAEPVIGLPCEGCENVFVGMPAAIASNARIAPATEPGERLRIEGVVREPGGSPVPGIVVYAYQTDAEGIYPRAATRHGKLRGWARSDESGRYRFDTIRPGSYPGRKVPQHIHMHVIEPGQATYYLDDIEFDDDPLMTDEGRRRHANGRGGSGLVEPVRDEKGLWRTRRDIVLRKNLRVPLNTVRPASPGLQLR